jgi:hypothetical protein
MQRFTQLADEKAQLAIEKERVALDKLMLEVECRILKAVSAWAERMGSSMHASRPASLANQESHILMCCGLQENERLKHELAAAATGEW